MLVLYFSLGIRTIDPHADLKEARKYFKKKLAKGRICVKDIC